MIPAGDVMNVLRLLGSAFPTFPLDATTLQTYGQALSVAPFHELSVLNAAVARWVTTEDRYPTIAQLHAAYNAEVSRRLAECRAAEEQRALTRGSLFGGPDLDPGYATEALDVLRTVLAESAGKRMHRHPGGVSADCPTCSRSDEIAATFPAKVADLMARRGISAPAEPVDTDACPLCRDRGFTITDTEPFTARPCRECNPAGFARWEAGHRAPGHWCADCDDMVRGRR